MSDQEREQIAERFWSDEEVDRAIKDAVRGALNQHGRKGNPVAVWRDGKVTWVRVEDVMPEVVRVEPPQDDARENP